MSNFINEITFIFQRLTFLGVLDILLVTAIFFAFLMTVRDTQATVLLRGVFLIIISINLLTMLVNLPAFSWLISTILPALIFAVPVIFAPELRRGLERLGRATGSSTTLPFRQATSANRSMIQTIQAVVTAASRLSSRQHGALIVLQRSDNLQEYIRTGVPLNAGVTPELLLQIFYPNTPLHDGAVIVSNNLIAAAACVMPLSASGILNRSPDRKMGLRHRAALGISEACDAIAVIVSEETGAISITHNGRMIRRLDSDRLENLLLAFYRPLQIPSKPMDILRQFFKGTSTKAIERGDDR